MFAICQICVQDAHSDEVLMTVQFPEHGTPVSRMCMMTASVSSTLRVQKFNIWRLHFFKYLILGVHTQPAIYLQGKKRWTRTNKHVRFEVFMAVTMKNGVFWDVMPRGSCKNWRFGGT
jgi:hypothetical protein